MARVSDRAKAEIVLVATTLTFAVCFAVWMMNGVLITFLVDSGIYEWDQARIGWLIGTPVLTGAVCRLPAGILADRFGGRLVLPVMMCLTAMPVYLVSHASSYGELLLAGLGLGLSGASFAVGAAYVSLWFPSERQGVVLGIFGMGTGGAALTNLVAPTLLTTLTQNGADPEAWRSLPKIYAAILVVTAAAFWLSTWTKRVEVVQGVTLRDRLAPLREVRVWRFGLYYSFVFGGFVALSQWLIPYYVNVYSMSVTTAGLMAAFFSLPSGVIRAIGGWVSDRVGPRRVLYWTLGLSIAILAMLFPPRMELQAPGVGVTVDQPGAVTAVSEREVVVGADRYALQHASATGAQIRLGIHRDDEGFLFLPTAMFLQVPVVKVGDEVIKGQLVARGVTRIYFQANRWMFTGLVLLLGLTMGLASAAVFKHIPNYFPGRVGVVGGAVSMLGALGGFVFPILFGYLLGATGVWTTSWMLLAVVALGCLVWMHATVRRMMRAHVPDLMREIDQPQPADRVR